MLQRDVRLGDDIDDFCVRCKRVMNHAVVSVVGGIAAKVRCRICHSDHDFRHEQPPPPKVDSRKAALFNEVLKTVDPSAAGVPLDEEVAAVELTEGDALDTESAEESAALETPPFDLDPEMEAPEPAEAMAAAAESKPAKPAAKKTAAKGKAKAKK
jgi:hypothetical protein